MAFHREIVVLDPGTVSSRGTCSTLPTPSAAGPVAGTLYTFTEPGVSVDPQTGQINFFANTYTAVLLNGTLVRTAGANPAGGSSAACSVTSTDDINRVMLANSLAALVAMEEYATRTRNDDGPGTFFTGGFEVTTDLVAALCGIANSGNF